MADKGEQYISAEAASLSGENISCRYTSLSYHIYCICIVNFKAIHQIQFHYQGGTYPTSLSCNEIQNITHKKDTGKGVMNHWWWDSHHESNQRIRMRIQNTKYNTQKIDTGKGVAETDWSLSMMSRLRPKWPGIQWRSSDPGIQQVFWHPLLTWHPSCGFQCWEYDELPKLSHPVAKVAKVTGHPVAIQRSSRSCFTLLLTLWPTLPTKCYHSIAKHRK